MLANNNQAVIARLARNSVKTNRKQYGILFFHNSFVCVYAFLRVYHRDSLSGGKPAAEYTAERGGI